MEINEDDILLKEEGQDGSVDNDDIEGDKNIYYADINKADMTLIQNNTQQ